MIVPSAKLIRASGLIVVPLATAAGVFPDLAGLGIGAIVLFFLLAGIDAARGAASLEGLTLTLPASEDVARSCAGWEAHLEMLAAALEGVPIKFPFESFKAAREAYKAQLGLANA